MFVYDSRQPNLNINRNYNWDIILLSKF